MSYSIPVGYKTSRFEKFVQRLAFGKPPKFKAPDVGPLEWIAVASGGSMCWICISPTRIEIIIQIIGGLIALAAYLVGYMQPKRKICTPWKVLKVTIKYWIYYTVGFNLIMTFLARKQTLNTGYVFFLIYLIIGILLNYFSPSDYNDGDDETA